MTDPDMPATVQMQAADRVLDRIEGRPMTKGEMTTTSKKLQVIMPYRVVLFACPRAPEVLLVRQLAHSGALQAAEVTVTRAHDVRSIREAFGAS